MFCSRLSRRLKLEEIEDSHRLGGVGDAKFLSYTLKYISLSFLRHTMSGWVVITVAPVYMCEQGGGDGEGTGSEEPSLL